MVTTAQIKKLFPTAKPVLIAAVVDHWSEAETAGINNTKRISEFFANIGVETGGLTAIVESLNYSVETLLKTFGRHRISEADARRLGRKKGEKSVPVARQREIANLVYGGAWGLKNLGNRPGTNDGWERRGAGMMQSTGLANQTALGFADNPAGLSDPVTAFRTAIREFVKRGCLALADKGETALLRKRINGGSNGLAEVRAYRKQAMAIFAGYTPASAPVKPAKPVAPVKPAKPVVAAPVPADAGLVPLPIPDAEANKRSLKLGDKGIYVSELKTKLAVLGYGPLAADDIFDQATHAAVKLLQENNPPLEIDGKAGPRTQDVIGGLMAQKELAPELAEAKKSVPQTADKAVEENTGLIAKVGGALSAFGLSAAGVAQQLFGAEWKTVLIIGGIALVGITIVGTGWLVKYALDRRFDAIRASAKRDSE